MAVGAIGIGGALPNPPITTDQAAFQGLGQSLQIAPSALIFDTFDRPNQLLQGSLISSGNARWVVSGSGGATAEVLNGAYVLPTATSNSYAFLPANAPIAHIEASFSFTPTSGGSPANQPGGLFALNNESLTEGSYLLFNFGPSNWTLFKNINGAGNVSITGGVYNTLLCDGTVYKIAMDFNLAANSVVITAPDGTQTTVTDANIGVAIKPQWGCWEIGTTSTNYALAFNGVAMGTSVAPLIRGAIGAAPMEEITLLKGYGMAQKSYVGLPWSLASFTGGPGWYTIAQGNIGTQVIMAGRVKAWAYNNPTGFQAFDINVAATHSDNVVSITQNNALVNAGVLTQVRLSMQSGTPYVQLDVYCTEAVTAVFIEFEGIFTPIAAPVVGATALSGASLVATIGVAPPQQAYTTNSSTNASTVLTAANICAASVETILNLTGAITSASNAQLPTALSVLQILAASQILVGGSYYEGTTVSFKLRIINGGGSSSGVWTIIADAGPTWTLDGTMTIAVGYYRDFLATITSSSNVFTGTLQSLGTVAMGAI